MSSQPLRRSDAAHRLVHLAAVLALAGGVSAIGAGPKFLDDDPLAREPETADARRAQPYEIDLSAALLYNLFALPRIPEQYTRALNANTADDVPDSSWFTNRIYARPVTRDEIARGPNTIDGPSPGRWTVTGPKSAGAAPGFRMRDSRGESWFISLDPKGSPAAATGAIAVACRLFWALGYFQVESYLTTFRPEDLAIDERATITTRADHRRPMRMSDVKAVLARSARNADGSYRALAARNLPGKVLGGFRYSGTRPDDPNDIVPHQHRRELRALKVFGAWTNLVDLKSLNTLDTLVTENGRGIVRHYLQDVGSTFGTGANGPREWDEGYEYLVDLGPLWKRLVTFGFYLQPWQTIPYDKQPQIGRFEGDHFDPESWVSRVPAAPVLQARDDDTFWAALRVAEFSEDQIRAAVHEGRYSDAAAEQFLVSVLMKRRTRIAATYLTKASPLDRFILDDSHTLSFENAALRAGVLPQPPGGYGIEWYSFDNATHDTTPIGDKAVVRELRASAPPVFARDADRFPFIKVVLTVIDPAAGPWTNPVDVYFRRRAGHWQLVGVERRWLAESP